MKHLIHPSVRVGKNLKVKHNSSIWENVEIGDNVSIGCNVVIHPNTKIGNNVVIEDNSVIGKRAKLAKISKEDLVKKEKGLIYEEKPLIIKDNVRIKSNVVILDATTIGENSYVGDGSFIREEVDIGNNVLVGSHVIIENRTKIGDYTKIEAGAYITGYSTIEDNVFIGPRVSTSNDKWMGRTEKRFKHRYGAKINSGARIGLNSIILPEITVGKEAVVGAGAVVTKDVPDYTVVVGSPAKHLKLVPKEEVLQKHLTNYPEQEELKQISLFDLKRQYLTIKEEIDAAIKEVVNRGQFILGENVKELEKEIASYIGTKHAVGVASGTDALLLALKAINIKQGDEVITTPNTFFATAGAIYNAGAKPVFVDIDKDTLNIDYKKLERSITKKTKAIIPVHLYGNPCDMDKITKIADEYKLYIIEDCAQAIGSVYKDKKVGSIGHIGAFSFFPTKNLGCYGDGGIVTTNDDKLAERLKMLRKHGFKQKHYSQEVGLNSRLDELQAAILRVKLKKLENWTERKRKIAKLYSKLLKNIVKTPLEQKDGRHVYHLYTIQTAKRDELKHYLESKGIMTEVYYPLPLHLQECFKYLKYKKGSMPISEKTVKDILSLPIYAELTDEEVTFICNEIKNFFKK